MDKGYRGHTANKFRVWISGQMRPTPAAIQPVIGHVPVISHVNADHRMDRNFLKGRDGDRINAVLAAVGYNFSLLLQWFAALLRAILRALLRTDSTTQIA